jgi:hypothetical protein
MLGDRNRESLVGKAKSEQCDRRAVSAMLELNQLAAKVANVL